MNAYFYFYLNPHEQKNWQRQTLSTQQWYAVSRASLMHLTIKSTLLSIGTSHEARASFRLMAHLPHSLSKKKNNVKNYKIIIETSRLRTEKNLMQGALFMKMNIKWQWFIIKEHNNFQNVIWNRVQTNRAHHSFPEQF